jgi:hypothetical protein
MTSMVEAASGPTARRGWVPTLEFALTPRYSPDERAWPFGYARRAWLPAGDLLGARQARLFATATCADWGLGGSLVDAVVSCVNELATNAMTHVPWAAMPPPHAFAVDLRLFGTSLAVEVSDPDPRLPVIPSDVLPELPAEAADGLASHGWGLYNVAAQARGTGGCAGARLLHVDGVVAGKSVWACFLTEEAARDG